MSLEEEQQSSAENLEQLSEVEQSTSGEADAPEVVETDEQKNERVQREATERARLKEEKRQASVQRRMDELTADKYAERKRADQLAEQNAKILALLESRSGQAQANPSGEPTREQFTDYEDFVTARAEWRAEQKAQAIIEQFSKTQTETQAKAQAEQSEQAIAKQFLERRAAAEKEIPDFRETVQDWEPQLPNSVVDMILKVPEGALISYHLAKNPGLEAQFRDSPAYMHGVILGQLIATLKSPPKVSSAPAPGKPVAAKPGTSSEPPSNPDAYYAWAKKHLR